MENPADLQRLKSQVRQAGARAEACWERAFFGIFTSIPFAGVGAAAVMGVFEFTKLHESTSQGAEIGYMAAGGLAGTLFMLRRQGARPIQELRQWRRHKKEMKAREVKYNLVYSWANGPQPLKPIDEMIVDQFVKRLNDLG